MEYAISIAVVAIFICLYLLTRAKIRARYFDFMKDGEFFAECKKYVNSLPLPKEGGKTDAKQYAATIKHIMRIIKRKKYCGFFKSFAVLDEDVKSLLKTDFTNLDDLPSIENEPRAVKLARFCLAHSDYNLKDERVKAVLNEQNAKKTLSFSEIVGLNSAFTYVLTEKICYLYLQLDTLAKVYNLSAKYVYNPILLNDKYKKLAKSRLFLSICATYAGYKMEYFANVHAEVTDKICSEIKAILQTINLVKEYDFSRFYTPLEILDKFEVFSSAAVDAKKNFLALIKKESDKENLDEFLYTVRLEKYMQSASAGHVAVKRLNLFTHTICIVKHKKDITMLAAALGSKHFMNLYFAPQKHYSPKSISKMLEYENSFEPIYRFHSVNFGISTAGGKLRIAPSLPRQIEKADVVFDAGGVKNTLHIIRGNEKQMYIGDTLITGIEQIRLGNNPLDITVKIPRK